MVFSTMSMPYQTRKQLLMGQLSIIIFSIAAGFLGRGSKGYWLFVIIYFIAYAYLMQKVGQPGTAEKKAKPAEVESGKLLFEEKSGMQLVSQDREYQLEMQEQMKLMQSNMFIMIGVLAYFFLAYKPLIQTIAPLFSDPRIGSSVAFLALFEGSFVLSWLGQLYTMRKMKKMGKKSIMINTPRGFIITDKGIVYQGIMSKTALKFPITGYQISYNAKRKFVEFVKETDKMIMKIRLYTKSPEKVYDIIMRKNEKALRSMENK
jgi:uncharacterized membrane protein